MESGGKEGLQADLPVSSSPPFPRWTSGAAPLSAHPLAEAIGFPRGPSAFAVHRLLPGRVGGAAVALQRPDHEHAGGQRRLCGGNAAARLLPADQVQRREEGVKGEGEKKGIKAES